MANASLPLVLLRLRECLPNRADVRATDRDLLDAFASSGDADAFAVLVRRHGPMVLGVCRRLLGHLQDAEDAFQATFLVLARHPHAIRRGASLSSWLYGVASRIAMKARRDAGRRRKHETRAPARSESPPAGDPGWREVQAVLDEEVLRLPAIHRAVFVACCLNGLNKSEAASELGLKEGTVSSRLAAARKRLQTALRRRGIELSAVLAALAVSGRATARVPAALLEQTTRAAPGALDGTATIPGVSDRVLSLMQGATTPMTTTKITLALVLPLVAGLVGFAARAIDSPRPTLEKPAAEKPATPPAKPETAATDKPLLLEGHTHSLQFAAFTDSGKALLTGDILGIVRVCDPATGKVLRSFKADELYCAALSPDARTLAVGGWKELHLYDRDKGAAIWKVPAHHQRIRGVAFTPDGKTLVTGAEDGVIRTWDSATGNQKDKILWERPIVGRRIQHLVLHPDGKRVAYAAIQEAPAPGQPPGGPITPDKLVTIVTLRVRDLATGQEFELTSEQGPHGLPAGVRAMGFSADGSRLAAALETVRDGTPSLRVLDVSDGHELLRFEEAPKEVAALAWSPDGRTLATIDWAGTVRLWEIATGKQRGQCEAGKTHISMALTFSPDGRRLVVGAGTVGVWDLLAAAREGADDLTKTEPDKLWADLADADPKKADRAARTLAASPDRAVRLLAGWLREVAEKDVKQIAKWIGQLISRTFTAREQATKELEKIGVAAVPAMRKALADSPDPELRKRLENLLARDKGLIKSPEALRTVRAVEVLERLGTDEARKALEGLAKDQPATWPGEQARQALSRLRR